MSKLKQEHYSVGKFINWGLTAYTQVHVYKALCLIANYPEYYSVFMKDVAYWSSFDPSFSMPALLMLMNYTLL